MEESRDRRSAGPHALLLGLLRAGDSRAATPIVLKNHHSETLENLSQRIAGESRPNRGAVLLAIMDAISASRLEKHRYESLNELTVRILEALLFSE